MSEEPDDSIDDTTDELPEARDEDVATAAEEDEEYMDVETELEGKSGEQGRASEYMDRIKGFFRSDPESDKWGEQPAAIDSSINRRGLITAGAGALVLTGGAAALADEVDLEGGDPGTDGGPVPPEIGGEAGVTGVENGSQYRWDSEQDLMENTSDGFWKMCNPATDSYIGTIDAERANEELSDYVNGSDPSGTLSAEEIEMTLEDITEVQGTYALDVDRRQGNDGEFGYFVQLVGEEDGGTYITRDGAVALNDFELEEAFDGYSECN